MTVRVSFSFDRRASTRLTCIAKIGDVHRPLLRQLVQFGAVCFWYSSSNGVIVADAAVENPADAPHLRVGQLHFFLDRLVLPPVPAARNCSALGGWR